MKNKILVRIIVPEVNSEYDVFIPVNELIWKIKALLAKSISDLTGGNFEFANEYVLLNPKTNQIYGENDIVSNTDIRNATDLILISTTKKNPSKEI